MGGNVGKRLLKIREELQFSLEEFAAGIREKPETLAEAENESGIPGEGLLEKVTRRYGISLEWLKTGNGDAWLSEIPENDDPSIVYVDLLSATASAGRGVEHFEMDVVRKIPVLNRMIAPYSAEKVKAVRVKGDSMTPTLFDSDIVYYVPRLVEYNGLYVISCFNELLCKRLDFQLNGDVQVLSDNSHYARQVYPRETDLLTIAGKVIGWTHRQH
jgi:phage repressor protein C with HTH and peptisase S24 domain